MRLIAVLCAFFFAAAAGAQELGPEELVKKVTADVLDTIKSDKQLQAGDRKKALALAEEKVLPHVDFKHATQIAVGRAWRTATPAQQDQLTQQFRSMLIRIYSSAIDVYRGQTMKVLPVRVPPGATETRVRNEYLREGRQPVPIEYSMMKTPSGWKIYDISVEGISLVLTYRSEFESIVRTAGVDGLIKRMAEKNSA